MHTSGGGRCAVNERGGGGGAREQQTRYSREPRGAVLSRQEEAQSDGRGSAIGRQLRGNHLQHRDDEDRVVRDERAIESYDPKGAAPNQKQHRYVEVPAAEQIGGRVSALRDDLDAAREALRHHLHVHARRARDRASTARTRVDRRCSAGWPRQPADVTWTCVPTGAEASE